MQESNNLQNKVCFFGEQFSEETKNFLRNEVCKDLPVEFEQEGKFYCVLHLPSNQKRKNTNFAEVVKQRIDSQENNFCGTYFSKNTNFKNHTFKTDANFEQTYFEDVSFDNVIFEEEVTFAFSALKKSRFQNSKFKKLAFFIETVFAADTILWNVVPSVDFSKTIFSDAVFLSCIFHNKAHFNDVTFQEASFSKSMFKNGVGFFLAKFLNKAGFDDAVFEGSTEFNRSIFDCDDRDKKSAKEKSFIISTSFRNAKFQDVRFTNTTFEATDFKETVFDKVQFWESTFNSYAGFESSIFKSIDFYKVKFLNEADFKKAKFQDKGGFFWSEFADRVSFNDATFDDNCDILFNSITSKQFVDFSSSIIKGYISFIGTLDEKLSLNLEHARFKNPKKLSLHTVNLNPNWFVNVDCRNIEFTNADWGQDFGTNLYIKSELENLKKRGIANSKQLLKVSCRQLAENAENNNRFEEASKFRQMAFEIELLERKEKISKWWSEEFTVLDFLTNFWEKIKTVPYDFAHFAYRWTSSYGESSSWTALVLLFLILIIIPLTYTQTNFYVCSIEKTNVQNDSVCETRTLYLSEAMQQSLATATLQNVESRKPDSPTSETLTILEKIFAPIQAALLALAIRRKFMR